MKKIFVNIGNTHCQFLYGEDVINSPTKDIETSLKQFDKSLEVYVASVVPQANKYLESYFSKSFFLSAENCSLDLSTMEDGSIIGADRLANMLACTSFFSSKSCLVIDCGSCFTGELISKDKKYLGGFILPGRQLQRDALATMGNLPQLQARELASNKIVTKTTHIMEFGVDYGLLGSLKELINYLNKSHLIDVLCFTGTDGKKYATFFENSIYNFELIFEGIRYWSKQL